MGKQYNKQIKRRRRMAYLARRKAEQRTELASTKKATKAPSSKPRKKAAAKPAAKKVEKEVVAEKAQPDDVLGPETGSETAPKEEEAPTKE